MPLHFRGLACVWCNSWKTLPALLSFLCINSCKLVWLFHKTYNRVSVYSTSLGLLLAKFIWTRWLLNDAYLSFIVKIPRIGLQKCRFSKIRCWEIFMISMRCALCLNFCEVLKSTVPSLSSYALEMIRSVTCALIMHCIWVELVLLTRNLNSKEAPTVPCLQQRVTLPRSLQNPITFCWWGCVGYLIEVELIQLRPYSQDHFL